MITIGIIIINKKTDKKCKQNESAQSNCCKKHREYWNIEPTDPPIGSYITFTIAIQPESHPSKYEAGPP